MANLGTLNQMGYGNGFGTDATDTFNKYMARQIAANGSDLDKLLYIVGGAVGNAMRKNREGRDNKKLDKIIEGAKSPETEYVGNGVGVGAMTPEQYSQIMGANNNLASVASAQPGDGSISIGQQPNVDISGIAALGNQGNGFVQKTTNNGLNNYNMDYIKRLAREQGIDDRILKARESEIQKDIAQNANSVLLPQIEKNLYGYTDGEGNYHAATTDSRLAALSQINELSKYSPEMATAYRTLAANGMQGDINFARQKELKQMDIDSKFAVAGAKKSAISGAKDVAYFDKQIDEVMRAMEKIESDTAKDVVTAKENGTTYNPTGTARDERYTALKDRLKTLKQQRDQLVNGGNGGQSQSTETKKEVKEGKSKSDNPIDQFFNDVDYDDYNQMLSDGKTPDGDGVVHPKGAFYKLQDYLQSAKKNDGSAYTQNEINTILMDLARKLPNWGEGSNYYEQLAGSLGVPTYESQKKAEREAALAEMERQRRLQEVLHPTDPMKGVRDTGTAIAQGKPLWNIASKVR